MMIQNGFAFAFGVFFMLAAAVSNNSGLAALGFAICYFGGL